MQTVEYKASTKKAELLAPKKVAVRDNPALRKKYAERAHKARLAALGPNAAAVKREAAGGGGDVDDNIADDAAGAGLNVKP